MAVTLLRELDEPEDASDDVAAAFQRLSAIADRESAPRPARRPASDVVLQVMNAMFAVLTVRVMLLLAVIGAFALAWQAITDPSELKIWILGVYSIVTIAPLAWLSRAS